MAIIAWLATIGAAQCTLASDLPAIDPALRGRPDGYVERLATDLGTRKQGADWPTFLGPTHNSVSTETGILTDWPERGPRIVWTQPLGNSYSAPVVGRGRLFLSHAFENTTRLACFNSETGEELWKFEYPIDYHDLYHFHNGARNSPMVDDNRVYLFGIEGMLHCLQVADGKPLWTVNTTVEFGVVQNFFGVGCSPVVEGDLLIVQIGGSPPHSPEMRSGRTTGNGSGIVAFNKYTGKVVYKITDELASYSSPVLTTIENRRWCFVFARGGLVGFEPQSGKVDFHYPWRAKVIDSVNACNPVVVGDKVFISEAYDVKRGASLLRVFPGGYDVLWTDAGRRDKILQSHFITPVQHEGFLYGCSSSALASGAELRCVDWASGKIMWSETSLPRTSLLYADGHFVCLSEDGTLRLIKANPLRYEPIGEATLRDSADVSGAQLLKHPAWAAPILSHGLLYVRGANRLVCLELIPER
ncbi:MAG: PQQ-binding-like beta-propeller repeat protein [Pirellulales bacterium]|nr:PQQ-binding-like beta-propeller repeat protein [Pirellulales bacterium]